MDMIIENTNDLELFQFIHFNLSQYNYSSINYSSLSGIITLRVITLHFSFVYKINLIRILLLLWHQIAFLLRRSVGK